MKYLREAQDSSLFLPPIEFRTRRQIANLRKTQHKSTDQQQQLNFIKFQKKESEEQPEGIRRFKKAAHVVEDMIRLEHFSSTHEKDWVLRKEAGVSFWVNKNTGEVSTIRPWESHVESRRGATAPGGPRSSVPRLDAEPTTSANTTSTKSLPNATNNHTVGAASSRKASSMESTGGAAHHHSAWDEESHNSRGSAASSELPELGTGCLVYDSSEVENLFAMLDADKK